MNDEFTIRLNVGGIACRLTINRQDEQIYRDAASLVNGKISQYRERYAKADLINLLAITALHHTVELLDAVQRNDVEPVIKTLEKVNKKLDEVVKE